MNVLRFLPLLFFGLLFKMCALDELRLAYPDANRIELYKERILKDKARINLQKKTFLTCCTLAAGYGLYRLLTPSSAAVVPTLECSSEVLAYRLHESNKMMDQLMPIVPDIKAIAEKLGCAKDGNYIVRIGKSILGELGGITKLVIASAIWHAIQGSFGPVSRYVERAADTTDRFFGYLFYEDGLDWFLCRHTNYHQVLSELELCVNEQDFCILWSLYINQLESILAYMQLKQIVRPEVKPDVASYMMRLHAQLLTLTDDVCNKAIQDAMAGVRQYADAVQELFGHFIFLENYRSL